MESQNEDRHALYGGKTSRDWGDAVNYGRGRISCPDCGGTEHWVDGEGIEYECVNCGQDVSQVPRPNPGTDDWLTSL